MGAKLALRGHTLEVKVGRMGLTERIFYDDREVSSRSPFQNRTHVFWVMEGTTTVRYVVVTGEHREGTIRSVVRNGQVIYLRDQLAAAPERGGASPAED